MPLIKRSTKGSPLTHAELDGNFEYIEINKANKDLSNVSSLPDAVKAQLMGPKGDTGLQGMQGAPGTNGANGATWRSGSGVPTNSLGENGDFYLNTTTYDVLHKSSEVYVVVCNIKGLKGDAGNDGANGAGQLTAQNINDALGYTPSSNDLSNLVDLPPSVVTFLQ